MKTVRAAPRIALVGTCQVGGMASAMRALLPDAEVRPWHVAANTADGDDEILAQLPSFDLIVSQLPETSKHEALRISRLRAAGLNCMFQPPLVFGGLHPDTTYLRKPNRGVLHGFLSDYHSTIVASAYVLGVPARRVPSLFNNFVYAELGYFEVFEAARSASLDAFREAGYDLDRHFDDWLRRIGQFMYSQNHPNIEVLKTLALLVLAKAGMVDPGEATTGEVEDYLATAFIWPVYPGLAKRLGLEGSATFLRDAYGLAEGELRDLSLQDYVAGSYEIYSAHDRDHIRTGIAAVERACERLSGLIRV